jgi:polysaccharide deacetylase 2 family uncharacterized protein YibQ
LAVVCLAGCKKAEKPYPVATLHGLTRNFAAAAKSAGPARTLVRTQFRADDGTDHVDVTIFSRDASSRTADRSRILQALNAVAVSGGLTEKPGKERGDGLAVLYLHNEIPTHTIDLHFGELGSAASRVAQGESSSPGGQAKLAILLDDLGSDSAVAEEIFRMPYPLTVSVLPGHTHSVDIAKEAHERGCEVMLHLPMQSVGKEQPEARELRPGMESREVTALVEQFLGEVPGVKGVNNHQGSQATADPALMNELMSTLRVHHLFYVDSRTTAATVAYDTAKQDGVEAAFRNVPFLDDVETDGAIEKQLALAMRGARDKGEAIAIGHPHAATLRALRVMLPKAESEGIRLVFVSELVH